MSSHAGAGSEAGTATSESGEPAYAPPTTLLEVEKPSVTIQYCTGCRWMLRAAWTAQELLTTFEADVGEISLRPAESGVFRVWVGDNVLLWDRKAEGRFPEMRELKQRLREHIAPGKGLGHSDKPVVKP